MFLPLEVPESINELARRPRIPKLLRRRPLSPFAPRNSLFRWITGVSAIGRGTVLPAGGSGDLKPFVSAGFDRAGRPRFPFFSCGAFTGDSVFRDARVEVG